MAFFQKSGNLDMKSNSLHRVVTNEPKSQ